LNFIIKIVSGVFIAGVGMRYLDAPPLFFLVGFVVVGIIFQSIYARLLNNYLGGVDPVREFRARSLRELRGRIPIPYSVVVVEILAKAFGIAALFVVARMFHILDAP